MVGQRRPVTHALGADGAEDGKGGQHETDGVTRAKKRPGAPPLDPTEIQELRNSEGKTVDYSGETTQRKPTMPYLRPGTSLTRSDARRFDPLLFQEPPRKTLFFPDDDPAGFRRPEEA